MHSMRRAGFTIVELLAVMVIVAILGAIALQSYKKVTYRARAATIVSDLGAIRTAAHQYQAEESVWPEDVDEGEIPPGFEPYMEGISFRGEGYELDWDNWGETIGISVLVDDPGLESALLGTLQTSEGTFMRMGNRYTYFVESTFAPEEG